MKSELQKLLGVRDQDYRTHLSCAASPLSCAGDIEALMRLHFVLPDGSGEPRFKELARMLVRYITLYCFEPVRRKDLSEVEHNSLFMEARELFRKAQKSGQAGEMLVYFLIEAILEAPQMLRKMPVSTNPKEERKGSDGVHFKWNTELSILEIYFAESKIWSHFNDAANAAFESITDFHSEGMKQHELNLVSANLRLIDSQLQERILSYIEGENAAQTRINQVCLIGFDWEEYKCLDDSRRKEFIAAFHDRYSQWARDCKEKIEEKLEAFPYRHLRFEFFLLPFKDVQQFRDWFEEALRG